jgi:hypothetical protein
MRGFPPNRSKRPIKGIKKPQANACGLIELYVVLD